MIQVLGLLAGLLTTISFVPQVIQTWKTHNTKAISFPMYLVLVTGILMWLIYGLIIQAPPVYLANAVTFVLALSILMMKIKYG